MNAPPAVVDPSLKPYSVRALRRNLVFQRLIEAWPTVDHEGSNEKVMQDWSRMSGVRLLQVREAWDRMFRNGWVRPDGTVDPFVERYLTALAIAEMPRDARPTRAVKREGAADASRAKETTPSARQGIDPFAAPRGDAS
jgi:hypothetical protein